MVFHVVDSISVPSDTINEDRFGHSNGCFAWVIDGATDVLEERLLEGGSDAAWFAEAAHRALRTAALHPPSKLCDLPGKICEVVATQFQSAARRKPAGGHEHPSATAIIVHAHDGRIDYAAVGDCALIASTGGGHIKVGLGGKEAGDRSTAEVVANFQAKNCEASPEDAKAYMWPRIRLQRARINQHDGYGALSLTPPPPHFVVSGGFEVAPGDHVLIASDGLTRLIEVYRRYEPETLLEAAVGKGLAALVAELRGIEMDDATCRAFPRVKARDDATGVLLRIL